MHFRRLPEAAGEGGLEGMGIGGAGNRSQGAGEKEMDVRDILKQELAVRQR